MLHELCRCSGSHGYKRTTEKLRRQPKLANCLRKSPPTKITLMMKKFMRLHGSRLECPAGHLPSAAEKDRLETFAAQRKPLPLYPTIRILHVWLVFVHARVFTITADSNARRYWLSTNGFVTE